MPVTGIIGGIAAVSLASRERLKQRIERAPRDYPNRFWRTRFPGMKDPALLTPPLRLADPLFQCVASDQRGSLAARRVSVKRFRHDIGSHLTERYLDIGHCSTVEGDSIIRITARREHFTEAQIVDLTLRTTVCGFFDKLNDALQIAKEPEAVSPPPPARPSLVLP